MVGLFSVSVAVDLSVEGADGGGIHAGTSVGEEKSGGRKQRNSSLSTNVKFVRTPHQFARVSLVAQNCHFPLNAQVTLRSMSGGPAGMEASLAVLIGRKVEN